MLGLLETGNLKVRNCSIRDELHENLSGGVSNIYVCY
jgi:hypothetical protein